MFDFLTTVAAILITLAFCALLVCVEVKEDERREKIGKEKARRLKTWLNKCSEARELDK